MVQVQVRAARVEDARGVAIVHVESWRVAYRGLIDQSVLDAQQVDHRADQWASWIAHSVAGAPTGGGAGHSHRLLVADAGGRIAGWASYGAGRDTDMATSGELAGIYVHPDFWSRGIGHVLIESVERELAAEGWPNAYLWVLRGNDRASRFYERHLWHADGAEKLGSIGGAERLHELRHVRVLR